MNMSDFAFIETLLFIILSFSSTDSAEHLHEPLDVASDIGELSNVQYNNSLGLDTSVLNCTTYETSQDFLILANGSLFLLGQNQSLPGDAFFLQNGTAYFCDEDAAQTGTQPAYDFSEEFTHCVHVLIEPQEYSLFKNGTIYIEIYSKFYRPSNYFIVDKGVYICVPSFEDLKRNQSLPYDSTKFSKTSDYVTFIGLLISIISLMTHLIIFCVIPAVRNLPGFCLASLSLSLLMAYICFLAAYFLTSAKICVSLGLCIYYFFLTSFFWMNAIAFDVWRSFRVVLRELRITSNRVPRRRFVLYSLYCWAIPAFLTVMVKVFDSTNILPEDFRPQFGYPFCWFGQRKALFLFFAVPLIIVMILNVIFFSDVIYVIGKATIKSRSAQDANLRRNFVMFTRLALIMGLTWVFGIAAGFADQPFLWYIFIVLNTLQGLFIFTVFLGSSKIRNLCYKQYNNRKRSSTSVRTISAAL